MSIISKFNAPSFLDTLTDDYFFYDEEWMATQPGPFQPTLHELKWLHYVLQSEKDAMFLSETTREKLAELLKEIPPLTREKWIQMKQMSQPEEMAFPFLKMLKNAIRNKQVCTFTYTTKVGDTFTEAGFPYELMYNIAKKRWYLQWMNEELLKKTTPLDRLEHVIQTDADSSSYEAAVENLEVQVQTAILQWKPRYENMDVHRFLHAFSAFRIQVLADDPLTMEIDYLIDEESFLLSKIRQFGPHVWIESPTSLQQKMVETAKRALKNYEESTSDEKAP